MNDANPRQQIVDSIKANNNVLVTVGTNPSVDELSAALGLTILLNNIGKRGTAVVSGQLPAAIEFLEPKKTFEHTTDSLRDFIIALDKEKADHLRYKVDGDVVKIFITPYRTQLSEKDLVFSLGDYNVEMVIALGVKDQDHLDKALDSHGAILHDATVATLMAGPEVSTLGSINWQDPEASSLSEMLVGLADMLKEEKPVLDAQVSTALLTGIVSATDRFSNKRTTSRVMQMAAQLMGAGANQQLIAAKLEEAHEIGPNARPTEHPDGSQSLAEGAGPTRLKKQHNNRDKKPRKPQDGSLLIEIDHPELPPKPGKPVLPPKPPASTLPPVAAFEPPAPQAGPETPVVEAPANAQSQPPAAPPETAEQALARELAEVVPPAESSTPKLDFDALLPKTPPMPPEAPATLESPIPPPPPPPMPPEAPQHTEGGYVTGQPSSVPPLSGAMQPDNEAPTVDPFATPLVAPTLPPLQPDPLFAAPSNGPQVGQTITPVHSADEIEYEESPIANDPAAVAAVPDFAAINPTGLATPPSVTEGGPSLDTLPPLPPLPPLPDLGAAPPPPPDLSLPNSPTPASPSTPPADAPPPPPGQFKIPGM